MIPKTIEVTVAVDGSLKINAIGFTGSDCHKATQFLEQALGQVKTSQRKPEFFNHTTITRRQHIGS